MASIHKRGEQFLVRWRDPDGTQRTRTCPDRRTAEILRLEVEQIRAQGKAWHPPTAAVAPILAAAQEDYLVERGRRKAARTLAGNRTAIEQFRAFLEGRDPSAPTTVDRLTRGTLEAFYGHLLDTTSVRTANKRVGDIHTWWAWLYDDERYDAHVQRPRRIELKQAPWAPPHAPTFAEMDALIAEASGWLRDAAIVMRFTGLRQRQVMALKWDDLDLDEGILHIRPELGKTRQERSGRVIPVSPYLIAHLLDVPEADRGGFLVAPKNKLRSIDSKRMVPLWRASGVRTPVWEGAPNHCFRYGFTTGLAQLGADREVVELLVGHAVPGARAWYLDPRSLERLREAVNRVPPLAETVLEDGGLDVVRADSDIGENELDSYINDGMPHLSKDEAYHRETAFDLDPTPGPQNPPHGPEFTISATEIASADGDASSDARHASHGSDDAASASADGPATLRVRIATALDHPGTKRIVAVSGLAAVGMTLLVGLSWCGG